jgi:hypothetical protein
LGAGGRLEEVGGDDELFMFREVGADLVEERIL